MFNSLKVSSCLAKVRISVRYQYFSRGRFSTRTYEGRNLFLLCSPAGQWLETKPVVPRLLVNYSPTRALVLEQCCCASSKTSYNPAKRSGQNVTFSAVSIAASNKQHLSRTRSLNVSCYSTTSSTGSESGSGISQKELKREMDELTDQFMETRELFADAMETKGSVYFDDDLEDAKQALDETLERYRALLCKLSEDQERAVVRTIGLKMDELRAQEAMILEELKEDE